MVKIEDFKRKKMAVYLRKSEGDKGTTQAQLSRIKKDLDKLEKEGRIKKLDRTVVGKDIKRKRRFSAKRDLAIEGDVFNEGEHASGFKFEQRPVFVELLKRIEKGEYDGIIVESMNRVARDFAGLSHLALPVWRQKGKVILSLNDGQILSDDRMSEAIINSQMTWGGIGKLDEIAKGEAGRIGTAVDKGFFKGSKPEFLGSKTKGQGLDYRKAWELMKAYGEIKKGKRKGNLNDPTAVAKAMGKMVWDSKEDKMKGDNKWAKNWYERMRDYEQLGVLDEWLNSVAAVNQYIDEREVSPRRAFKDSAQVGRILYASTGYFAYPAGVNIAGTDEFVLFPSPISVGLDILADAKDPLEIPTFNVVRTKVTGKKLNVRQTQPRTRKGGKR